MGFSGRTDAVGGDIPARGSLSARTLDRQADALVGACMDMADRFRQGGTLLVFGADAAGADTQHVAVEFTHPVLVGKRAIPAVALTAKPFAPVAAGRFGDHPDDHLGGHSGDAAAGRPGGPGGDLAGDLVGELVERRLRLLARPGDVALAIAPGGLPGGLLRALRAARELGLLTVAMAGAGVRAPQDADHVLLAGADDPRTARELQVTTYHLLWEIVHLCLEHADVLPAAASPAGSAGLEKTGVEKSGFEKSGSGSAAAGPQGGWAAGPEPACGADEEGGGSCVTCSDEASPARVLRLLDADLAEVDTGEGTAVVSVALVDARVGQDVLVHAGEAIGLAGGSSDQPVAEDGGGSIGNGGSGHGGGSSRGSGGCGSGGARAAGEVRVRSGEEIGAADG